MMPPGIPDDRQVIQDDLYREIILDHYRHPRCHGVLPDPDIDVRGTNPLCGDEVRLTLRLSGGRVERVGLEAKGCAISRASSSMMAEALRGRTVREVRGFARRFKAMLLENAGADTLPEPLEDLKALENVRAYPVRIKCALLAWNTLLEGLTEDGDDGKD